MDIPYSYSWIERLNIVKMSVLPKLIYRLNVITIKIPINFSVEVGKKLILNFRWKY